MAGRNHPGVLGKCQVRRERRFRIGSLRVQIGIKAGRRLAPAVAAASNRPHHAATSFDVTIIQSCSACSIFCAGVRVVSEPLPRAGAARPVRPLRAGTPVIAVFNCRRGLPFKITNRPGSVIIASPKPAASNAFGPSFHFLRSILARAARTESTGTVLANTTNCGSLSSDGSLPSSDCSNWQKPSDHKCAGNVCHQAGVDAAGGGRGTVRGCGRVFRRRRGFIGVLTAASGGTSPIIPRRKCREVVARRANRRITWQPQDSRKEANAVSGQLLLKLRLDLLSGIGLLIEHGLCAAIERIGGQKKLANRIARGKPQQTVRQGVSQFGTQVAGVRLF